MVSFLIEPVYKNDDDAYCLSRCNSIVKCIYAYFLNQNCSLYNGNISNYLIKNSKNKLRKLHKKLNLNRYQIYVFKRKTFSLIYFVILKVKKAMRLIMMDRLKRQVQEIKFKQRLLSRLMLPMCSKKLFQNMLTLKKRQL